MIKVALSMQGNHFKQATIRISQTTQLVVKFTLGTYPILKHKIGFLKIIHYLPIWRPDGKFLIDILHRLKGVSFKHTIFHLSHEL